MHPNAPAPCYVELISIATVVSYTSRTKVHITDGQAGLISRATLMRYASFNALHRHVELLSTAAVVCHASRTIFNITAGHLHMTLAIGVTSHASYNPLRITSAHADIALGAAVIPYLLHCGTCYHEELISRAAVTPHANFTML